jgi:ribonuclease HII
MMIAGVEEAGRGPVIGPMVMAICAIKEEDIPKLQALGVKDSKLILRVKRDNLLKKVQELCEYKIIILDANAIDMCLNDPEMNLNKLEGKATAKLINDIQEKIKLDKVILDCPSNNIPAYREYVSKLVTKETNIIAEHKADLNHTIVGAASILAKVTRDKIVDEIKKEVNYDFGSGYPSDPKTQEFIKNNWNKYDIFRKTWSTYKKFTEEKKQKKLGEY